MLKQALAAMLLAAGSAATALAAAPLPEAAKGVPIPQDTGFYAKEVADGLYFATEGVYTTMFLTTGQGVIVVDAPPTFGDKLVKAIEGITDEPITHVIYSHSHADHIAGAGQYPASATYIAHADTKARLAAPDRLAPFGAFLGGAAVPLPSVTFDDNYTLTVGSQTLELAYHGDDHEPGNIYIYAPKQKVLMKVDIVFPGWTPFMDLAVSESVAGLPQGP